jgi:small-conductance mechanosensitive channel
MKNSRIVGLLFVVMVSVGILYSALYILSTVYHNSIIISYHLVFYGLLLAVGGVLITNLIASLVENKAKQLVGEATAGILNFFIKTVGYITVAILFFAFVRINIESALVAGGFAGIVIGLASQDVLGNIFGGIAIVGSRPFKVGDRITLSTWQYGIVAPSYPPKFYSNDFLIPGYTGKVTGISLMYTTLMTDDNIPLKIPNSVLIQSSIFIHSSSDSRIVRTKIEISKEIDPDDIIPLISKKVSELPSIIGRADVRIYETTFTSYVLVIQGMFKSQFEEPVRSEVLKESMKMIKEKMNQIRNTK